MNRLFKWWCCRYLLRVICVDCSYSDRTVCVFHRCRDGTYKPDRVVMRCEKECCTNSRRREHGTPKSAVTEYV